MLELSNIKKNYLAGENTVYALKGIDLQFREHEFVSILGPSGCGKTTMLNIIGGLDKYTSGDLLINGISTKEYKDKEWDTYRNHSVGFVFQSYNLIPHQTVLQNVELALTLSGVTKQERKRRAKEALEKVGLGDQLRKKPREMSGGQMQRVAIARAIVNNPDIILADEPTGALDTETSIQVMDILKEIARDHLVIMVTHNPELAEQYSTRIVRMLDGVILSDTMPLKRKEFHEEMDKARVKRAENAKKKKPSMSFATSFGLSLKNLFTKKGRTILTSFAGSIGIIGIALIYAVSQGMTTYIDQVQEQTLSSYPIIIEGTTVDMSSMLKLFMGKAESIGEHEQDAIYQKAMVYELVSALSDIEESDNDLESFKKYIEEQKEDEESDFSKAIGAVKYGYDLDLKIYSESADGEVIEADLQNLMIDLMTEYTGIDYRLLMSFRESAMMGNGGSAISGGNMSLWTELIEGDNGQLVSDVTKDQYDLVYGEWPSRYDEMIVFVDENQEIDDLTLYAMGLKTSDEMRKLMEAASNDDEAEYSVESWSYKDICDTDFRTILSSDCYAYDEITGQYNDLRETSTGIRYLYDNGMTLHITGIAKPSEDAVSSSSGGGIGYTHALTEYLINKAHEAEPVKAQIDKPETDIFTGLPFEDKNNELSDKEKADFFKDRIKDYSDNEKADTYVEIMSIAPEDFVEQSVAQAMIGLTREDMEATMVQIFSTQMNMDEATISDYLANMSDEEVTGYYAQAVAEQVKAQYAENTRMQLTQMPVSELARGLKDLINGYDDAQCAKLYDEILEFSKSTYEDNLIKLGCLDLNDPSSIRLYASSFEGKDVLEDVIAKYNESVDDIHEIRYTDYVGLIMSSVTTIINAITYVLIAFVAVSLVVSSIMIGVITLISVQERTKEIGILRALGASKKNVSRMFNAETLIIGFTSGIIGVGITYLLCIPINAILHRLTGISNLSARLPIIIAGILVLISMMLTLISGVIPSRSAAKKDPVVALRTE